MRLLACLWAAGVGFLINFAFATAAPATAAPARGAAAGPPSSIKASRSALYNELSFKQNSQIVETLLLDEGQLYDGGTGQSVVFDQLVQRLSPGQVLVLGETHDKLAGLASQVAVLWYLAWQTQNSQDRQFKYPQISVGFEHIDYTQQALLSDYAQERIGENEFWPQLNSWKPRLPRDVYQFHIQAPRYLKGRALALNAPRWLTKKISQNSLASLSSEERALLPPNFELGNKAYFERFKRAMRGHGDEQSVRQYFEAQSVWDDTMAWRAQLAMQEHPQQVLVIVVGDFHVRYGGGLPDRLRARGLDVLSVSQVFADEDPITLRQHIGPHKLYGPRGDFVLAVDDVELRFRKHPEEYQKLLAPLQQMILGLLGLLKSL